MALAVVMAHIWEGGHPWVLPGYAAVQCFYVISGFVIALVLDQKYQSSTGKFYLKRLLRLWPAYLAALFLSVAYLAWLWKATHIVHGPLVKILYENRAPGLGAWLFLGFTHVFMLGQDLASFFHLGEAGQLLFSRFSGEQPSGLNFYYVISQGNTLSIELLFYLAAPWLVRLPSKVLLGLAVAGLAFQAWAHLNHDWLGSWALRSIFVDGWVFLWGILAYRFSSRFLFSQGKEKAAVGLFFVFLAFYRFIPLNPELCLVLLTLATALTLAPLARISASWRGDKFCGELSYPLYVIHVLAIWMAMDLGPGVFGIAGEALGISLLLSYLLLRVIEKPVERLRQSL